MTRMRTRLTVALLVCAAFGCKALDNLTNPEPDAAWQENEVKAPSDRVLWKLTLLSVEQLGFPLTGGLDPSGGQIKSGWKTELHPFGRKGYRIRAQVEMSPQGPKKWLMKARVQKQINEAIVAPLDPARAEWKWAPDDSVAAAIILKKVESLLAPELELTEEKDPLDALLESKEGSN